MSIESTTNINGLNENTPTSEDSKSEGDNHLRLLKVVLRATFPGFAGKFLRFNTKAANYVLGLTDNATVIRFSAGATLSGVPATLGNGYMVLVYNDSTTNVIVDPSGSALVNGKETLNIIAKSAVLLLCDGVGFVAIGVQIPQFGTSNGGEFAVGTRLLFQQATAPNGWSLEVGAAFNDAALRIVTSGAVGTGGATAFSAILNGTTTGNGTALTVTQLPAHTHGVTINAVSDHTHTGSFQNYAPGGSGADAAQRTSDGINPASQGVTINPGGGHTHGASISNSGGDAAHTHTTTFNMKYVDFLLAQKL